MADKTKLRTREKGAGTIYRQEKRWYLKIRIAGRSKVTMLRGEDGEPCTRRTEAEAAANGYKKILEASNREELAVQIAIAKKLKRQSGLRLIDAWQTYLKQTNRPDSGDATLHKYKLTLDLFIKWINKHHPECKHAADIDDGIAKAYFGGLWESGLSSSSFNSYRQALCLIFKHLAAPAALDANPFDAIARKTADTVSRKELSEAQVAAIFEGFDKGFADPETGAGYKPMHADEMRVLLNLCCFTGCRGEDGCLMTWENVDLGRGLISYTPRKTARRSHGKVVTLPMHSQLREALTTAWNWHDRNTAGENYVIPQVAHRYLHNHSGIQKDVMRIIHCATGLQTTAATTTTRRKMRANLYSLHSFRHTFVSFCANSGVPLAVVAEIVGHGNPAMTRHYSHISNSAKEQAIAALPIIERNLPIAELPEPERAELHRTVDYLSPGGVRDVLNFIRSNAGGKQ
ncbi:MAG: tyrosine-type recombinase/integrase [Victivallaceae bacterium]|nr:tyrosine-type recombinase/integrase [Victivallaceae bacterium]